MKFWSTKLFRLIPSTGEQLEAVKDFKLLLNMPILKGFFLIASDKMDCLTHLCAHQIILLFTP